MGETSLAGDAGTGGEAFRFWPHDRSRSQMPEETIEVLREDIAREHRSFTHLQRLLGTVTDAVYAGYLHWLYLEPVLNQEELAYQRLEDVTRNPPLRSMIGRGNQDAAAEEVRIGEGYIGHGRGTPFADQVYEHFLWLADQLQRYSHEPQALVEWLRKAKQLEPDDQIDEIGVFGTAFIVHVPPQVWQRRFNAEGGNAIGMHLGTVSDHAILLPSNLRTHPEEWQSTLEHEYGHFLDHSVQIRHIMRDRYVDLKFHPDLWGMKSEVIASLSERQLHHLSWERCVAEIDRRLRGPGYAKYRATPALLERSDQLLRSLIHLEPYVVGHMLELGLDPADIPRRRQLTRYFLMFTPSRPAGFRMLEILPQTGVYRAGQDWLAVHPETLTGQAGS